HTRFSRDWSSDVCSSDLTGAQSGVLYISGLPVEKNVIEGIARKAKSFRNAFALVHGSNSHVHVFNRTSVRMGLPDASVDYVFTEIGRASCREREETEADT